MSQEDLFKALGRYHLDLAFSAGMQTDADGTLKAAGYNLEPDEREQLKNVAMPSNGSQRDLLVNPEFPTAMPPGGGGPGQPPPELAKKYWEEQHRFMIRTINLRLSLTEKALDVVKKTFDRAGSTFASITWMNRIMFAVGIGLFLYAAYLATSRNAQVYSLLFGGLGAANFIALFMFKPIERTQKALANLVQVQVAFMTYFDQISWWESLAQMGINVIPPDPSKIREASEGLQQRTLETLELLQRFVEEAKQPARLKSNKDAHKPNGHPTAKQSS
jgi:hypothetical protein